MDGKDTNIEPLKENEHPVNYNPHMSSDWHVNGNNITNSLINSMVEASACSSAPMVDSFCFPAWDQPINAQNSGYCDMNLQNDASTSSSFNPIRANMSWNPSAILKEGAFLPNHVPGIYPPNLPNFPDSGFIERAARFSCFGAGNFGEMMNSFSNRALGPIQNPIQGPIQDPNEAFEGKREIDEVKNGVEVSGNQSDEAEFSGRGGQEELEGVGPESSGKGLGSKKRKRIEHGENNEEGPQASLEGGETKEKGDQNPTSTSKPGGKNGKQGSQGADPPKEDYIHIRARRGQATNSHSLAERVRREKISERMKFLQDLVPGCSKVTGKAVMLDEIINYVQSLQRQVEFLSMKLATVNPRMDFNLDALLAKEILQPRVGMGFQPDMTMPFPTMHPSHPGLIQPGLLSGMGSSSEALRRPISLQSSLVSGGFKEPTSHVPSVWEDELHNVVHMGFNSSTPLDTQDLSGSLPSGHMKPEP